MELLTAIRAVARGEAFVDPAMTRAMIEGYLGATPEPPGPRSPRPPGEPPDGLTAREIHVLRIIAEGYYGVTLILMDVAAALAMAPEAQRSGVAARRPPPFAVAQGAMARGWAPSIRFSMTDHDTNKEVAERLVISVKTVETHKAHIAEKLGVKSRVEWLRYAREKGWLTQD